MAPEPCHGCVWTDQCPTAGLVNRLAIEAWIDEASFSCPDFTPDYYHGIEGVFA